MNTLELLLNMDPQSLPEKEVAVRRLSKACGQPVVFRLRGLPYSQVAEILERKKDTALHILLAGVVSPNLKDRALRDKYAAETPHELVKKLLLPGEIEDLSREIERLSGYRMNTLEEVEAHREELEKN